MKALPFQFQRQLPIVLRHRRWVVWMHLFNTSLLTLCGLFVILQDPPMGVLCTVFFGWCVFIFVLELRSPPPSLYLTYTGFSTCAVQPSLYTPQVRWQEIDAFVLTKINGQQIVGWRYHEQYRRTTYDYRLQKLDIDGYIGIRYGCSPKQLHRLMTTLLNCYRQAMEQLDEQTVSI